MTSGDYPGEAGAWALVIYGRTHHVDEWWRALPAGVTRDGRAAGVIKGAIADGRVPAPRFVLARLAVGTLVGVVCSASRFGTEMAADSFGRPLYCFVGWYSGDPRVAVPGFAELTGGWERLVLAAYDRVMRPVWLASADEARVPAVLEPEEAPWAVPSGKRLEELPAFLSDVSAPGDTVRVYPSASAALVWQAVADYGVRAAVVTGWETYRSAIRPYLTHVCADDFRGPSPMVLEAPPRGDRAAHGPSPREQTRPRYQPASAGTSRATAEAEHGDPSVRSKTEPTSAYGRADRGEGWRGDERRGGEWEAAGSGGGLLGGLKRAAQGVVSGMLSGGDADLPGDPPGWTGAWTFRPPATFEATDGPYVFWYTIGEQAIRCASQRTGQQFEWTGSHWVPVATAHPQTHPRSQSPSRAPGHGTAPATAPARYPVGPPGSDEPDLLDQPPVTGLGMVTPQAPPPDMRTKLKSTFSGFGRSTRDQTATPGADAEAQEGGTGPGDGSPSADSPPQTDQTTPP